jgi:hypothetical protein
LVAGALPDCRRQAGNAKTLSDWRSQAGVTTAPAIALAKAGQLAFIVRVIKRFLIFVMLAQIIF